MKQRVIRQDPMARYKHVFRAELDGDTVIVAGITEIQAAEEAAAYFGVTVEAFRERGTLNQPTAQEVKGYGRKHGNQAEMLVKNQRYGEAVVTALCREDALMQASVMLDAPMSEIYSPNTTVLLSGRVKYYGED